MRASALGATNGKHFTDVRACVTLDIAASCVLCVAHDACVGASWRGGPGQGGSPLWLSISLI
jgi:hypothetical protein